MNVVLKIVVTIVFPADCQINLVEEFYFSHEILYQSGKLELEFNCLKFAWLNISWKLFAFILVNKEKRIVGCPVSTNSKWEIAS